LLGIEDELAAYQFDVAAMTLGAHVETETQNGKKVKDVLKALTPHRLPPNRKNGDLGGGKSVSPHPPALRASPQIAGERPAKAPGHAANLGGGDARYASVARFAKKVKLKADGTWDE
jgi:hypothetical protein